MPGLVERPHILVHGKAINQAGTGDVELRQPANAPEWMLYSVALTYVVTVTGVTGSPTSWSLDCKFQLRQPDAQDATNDYMFAAENWFDLTPAQLDLIDEGVGWYGPDKTPPLGGQAGTIADDTDSPSVGSPIIVRRTIRPGGQLASLLFTPTLSGGTAPGISIHVVAIPQV